MSKSKFTTEQMKLLRGHPYVIQVSPNVVCFSKEFKEIVWTEMQRGRDIHEILEEYNLPCEILGETRISGLKGLIRRAGKAGKGFSDVNPEACRSNGFMPPDNLCSLLILNQKTRESAALPAMTPHGPTREAADVW